MKVLITGGRGFLGAWVARRLLARGMDVRSLDVSDQGGAAESVLGPSMQRVQWRLGDVSRREDVHEALQGCDRVIHVAGVLTPVCRQDPILGAQVNLVGTLNIFEAAKERDIRHVLYTSTAAVFGPEDTDCPRPVSHYGAFKLAAEGCARAYWHDAGICSFALRPLVIYGPGRELGPSAGVTLACRAAAEGRAYEIPFTGRSGFVYVDEVAAAFEAALLSQPQGASVYNMWGDVADVASVVRTIQELAPGARISAAGPVLGVPADIDSSALYRDFPLLQRIGLAGGLGETIAHYRRQRGQ